MSFIFSWPQICWTAKLSAGPRSPWQLLVTFPLVSCPHVRGWVCLKASACWEVVRMRVTNALCFHLAGVFPIKRQKGKKRLGKPHEICFWAHNCILKMTSKDTSRKSVCLLWNQVTPFFSPIFLKVYAHIADVQSCESSCCTTEWFSYTYAHIHAPADSFPT